MSTDFISAWKNAAINKVITPPGRRDEYFGEIKSTSVCKFYKMFIEKQDRTLRILYNQRGLWAHLLFFLVKIKLSKAMVTHASSFTVSLSCRGRFWHYLRVNLGQRRRKRNRCWSVWWDLMFPLRKENNANRSRHVWILAMRAEEEEEVTKG